LWEEEIKAPIHIASIISFRISRRTVGVNRGSLKEGEKKKLRMRRGGGLPGCLGSGGGGEKTFRCAIIQGGQIFRIAFLVSGPVAASLNQRGGCRKKKKKRKAVRREKT